MDKEQALQSFWSSFGIPAYDESSVPDKVWSEEQQEMVPLKMPYITYSVATGSLDDVIGMTASIWFYSSSWKEITELKNRIAENIGVGGKQIKLDHGYLWICRGSTFAQRVSDPDDMVRHIYLQIQAEFLTRD